MASPKRPQAISIEKILEDLDEPRFPKVDEFLGKVFDAPQYNDLGVLEREQAVLDFLSHNRNKWQEMLAKEGLFSGQTPENINAISIRCTIEKTNRLLIPTLIEEIRKLQNQAKYRPFEGEKRIFIIEDAERMNIPAANALLKTLEEPGPSNVLILTTSRPYLLPPTITSRCQKIRFSPLRKDVIVAFMRERFALDEELSLTLASSSEGSIGRVLEMRDESYIALKRELIEKITSTDIERNPMQLLLLIREMGGDRDAILGRMDILKSWYRDVLVFKEMRDRANLIHPDCADATKRFSERMEGPNILKSIKTIERAYSAIEKNANKQLTLESMMFKLAEIRRTSVMNELNV